jgi:hypothetical protein
VRDALEMSLDEIASGQAWRVCEAMLTLHAIADEACAGVPIGTSARDEIGASSRLRMRELLARTGTIARIDPTLLRVLPKYRTPPGGITSRSISRYVSVTRPRVEYRVHSGTTTDTGIASGRLNVLLLPWPLRVSADGFHRCPSRFASAMSSRSASSGLIHLNRSTSRWLTACWPRRASAAIESKPSFCPKAQSRSRIWSVSRLCSSTTVWMIELDNGDTIASLVCEDLAHIDDVVELLWAVGPTLVVALLLDGPQLASRWAARYASVLADNLGSPVLTLTSYGMVANAWRAGDPHPLS